MKLPQDKAVWIALALPVIMVMVVAAAIYIPRFSATAPQYDFLYVVSSGDYYGQDYSYTVRDGKLQREAVPEPPRDYIKPVPSAGGGETHLYVHDVATNTSREVSFEEAQALKLNTNLEAPDGYHIEQGTSGGVFPFFIEGGNYQNRYLVKGNYSQQIDVRGSDSRSYYGFQFLGWVEP